MNNHGFVLNGRSSATVCTCNPYLESVVIVSFQSSPHPLFHGHLCHFRDSHLLHGQAAKEVAHANSSGKGQALAEATHKASKERVTRASGVHLGGWEGRNSEAGVSASRKRSRPFRLQVEFPRESRLS